MTETSRWWNRRVPGGAKILAGVILALDLLLLAVLIFAAMNVDMLEEVAADIPELGPDGLALLQWAFPVMAGLLAISAAGLLLILFNRAWGFVLYALPPAAVSAFSLINGDVRGALSGLGGVLLMAFLLFFLQAKPDQPKPAASNYTYNTKPAENAAEDNSRDPK